MPLPVAKVPLINSYKYGLCRRRFLQSLFGGPMIRRTPWFIHFMQAVLWLLPLILSAPFIILDLLGLWNQYLLAFVYGCVVGITVLVEGIMIFIIRRHLGLEQRRIQFDDENETVDIPSFCSAETIDFIFSLKTKSNLFLHPFVSGLLSFVGCLLLLPTILQEMLHISLAIVVFVIGWLTLCCAHYPLSTHVPSETAVYRQTNFLGLRSYYRPFYFLALGSIFIPVRLVVASPRLYLILLYCALCLFPLGWLLGVLPPLDALLPWLMEQILTRLLGGSPMATDLRLGVAFVATVVAVTIGVVIKNSTASLLLLTAFGYLLSQDPYIHFKALLYLMSSELHNRIGRFVKSITSQVFSKTFLSYSGVGDVHTMSKNGSSYFIYISLCALRGYVMLLVSLLSVHFASTTVNYDNRDLLIKIFSGFFIGVSVFVFASDSFQTSYIFGIVRNPLLPVFTGDIAMYKFRKYRFDFVSLPRKIIIVYVVPLLAFTFVGLAMGPIPSNVFQRIAVARILRKVWQNTQSALIELLVVSVLLMSIPTIKSMQSSIGFPLLTLLVGLSLDVILDSLKKSAYVGKLFITFIGLRKQRTHVFLGILIGVCTLLFFPFLIAVIITSSILLAPLLPLFTLPIFVINFPRTRRFWPSLFDYGRIYLQNNDTIYYQQAEPEVAKAMYKCIACGSISSQPGTQVLFRFDNRIALVTILETEYGSCVISFRGLELQETSCHSEEATMVDNMFERVHDQNSRGVSCLNENILSTLLPTDTLVIETYSDARNVLTGIIDQPEALQKFSINLMKTLVWVFYWYCIKSGTKDLKFDVFTTQDDAELQTSHQVEELDSEISDTDQSVSFKSQKKSDSLSWVSIPSNNGIQEKKVDNKAGWEHTHGLFPVDRSIDNQSLENFQVSRKRETIPPLYSTSFMLPSWPRVHPDKASNSTYWTMPSLTQSEINQLMEKFPLEWYTDLTKDNKCLEGKEYEWLCRVVVGSFNILDVPSRPVLSYRSCQTTPMDITKGFHGKFPYPTNIRKCPELMSLALKAYRYAVKLMYDEGSLGEVESLTELVDYLEEYENEWCIVSEEEEDWKSAILSKCRHLFSMDHDPEKQTYTAHVLSLQDEVVHVGSLNSSTLEGMWANMSFELFYLTNDDEERYSIQAHPYLLRNISNQMSEPPLGNCVYSSGLITIPST